MNQVRECEFVVDGMRIAGQMYGDSNGVPVLAMHGWLDNCASFKPVANHLNNIQLLAIDMPGHGLSSHRSSDSPINIWDDLPLLLMLVDQLGWEQFSIIGHSRGAGIASLFSACFSERVSKLVLLDGGVPVSTTAEESVSQLAKASKAWTRRKDKRTPGYSTYKQALEARKRAVGSISEEAAVLLLERGLVKSELGYGWRTDPLLTVPSMLMLTPEQSEQFAAQIDVPVCMVLAEGGRIAKSEAFGQLSERFQDIEIHQLEGGHHLHMEKQAPAVADIINRFLVDETG
ncbi:MAG: alpha/beta hydrolase [Pseudomonadales bacterium]|nr:alpha/beta hydrolase [Pseudomonadales bacterium]